MTRSSKLPLAIITGIKTRIQKIYPWIINKPWTAQGWLLITQAASTHGKRLIVEYLLDKCADPTLSVGDSDDRTTVVEMARSGNNHELAESLEQIVNDRGVEYKTVPVDFVVIEFAHSDPVAYATCCSRYLIGVRLFQRTNARRKFTVSE